MNKLLVSGLSNSFHDGVAWCRYKEQRAQTIRAASFQYAHRAAEFMYKVLTPLAHDTALDWVSMSLILVNACNAFEEWRKEMNAMPTRWKGQGFRHKLR